MTGVPTGVPSNDFKGSSLGRPRWDESRKGSWESTCVRNEVPPTQLRVGRVISGPQFN